MRKTIFISALLLATGSLRPATAAQAPDFKVAQVLNSPLQKINGLKDLKGKVVFLDFWAT
jgi:hypothetical protein